MIVQCFNGKSLNSHPSGSKCRGSPLVFKNEGTEDRENLESSSNARDTILRMAIAC